MAVKQRKGRRKVPSQKENGGTKGSPEVGKSTSKHRSAARRQLSDRTLAIGIFLLAFCVYISDGGFNPGSDMATNIYLPLQIFRGKFWWTVLDAPILFRWKMKPPKGSEGPNKVVYMPPTMNGDVYSTSSENLNVTGIGLAREGRLVYGGPKYMLALVTRDADKENTEQRFVNTFNIGTGLTFVPAAALLAMYHRFDLEALQSDSWLLWHSSKVVASLLIAAAGSLLYLSARTFPSVSRARAAAAALVYCFCTGAWSVSSQGMSQHAPNAFYLSAAILALLTADRSRRDGRGWPARTVALCGLSVGMATLSRPTSAIVALSIGAYLLLGKRSLKASVVYAGAGSLLAALQLSYNWFCFENPLEFGQQQTSRILATAKTGSPDLWQTPLLTGAATLLFSPSRGLFVFSPLTIFVVPGAFLVWLPAPGAEKGGKSNHFAVLRPLVVSLFLLWSTAFKFYDYWGGWCYGYRPLVDTMPMMVLLLCVVMERVNIDRSWRSLVIIVLLAMAAWSIAVQYVGANAFDIAKWNGMKRVVVEVEGHPPEVIHSGHRFVELIKQHSGKIREREVLLDVDLPEYRERLWSWSDWQILYYMKEFKDSKVIKHLQMARSIKYL